MNVTNLEIKSLLMNQVKMKSYYVKVVSNPKTGILIRQGKFGHRETGGIKER